MRLLGHVLHGTTWATRLQRWWSVDAGRTACFLRVCAQGRPHATTQAEQDITDFMRHWHQRLRGDRREWRELGLAKMGFATTAELCSTQPPSLAGVHSMSTATHAQRKASEHRSRPSRNCDGKAGVVQWGRICQHLGGRSCATANPVGGAALGIWWRSSSGRAGRMLNRTTSLAAGRARRLPRCHGAVAS